MHETMHTHQFKVQICWGFCLPRNVHFTNLSKEDWKTHFCSGVEGWCVMHGGTGHILGLTRKRSPGVLFQKKICQDEFESSKLQKLSSWAQTKKLMIIWKRDETNKTIEKGQWWCNDDVDDDDDDDVDDDDDDDAMVTMVMLHHFLIIMIGGSPPSSSSVLLLLFSNCYFFWYY